MIGWPKHSKISFFFGPINEIVFSISHVIVVLVNLCYIVFGKLLIVFSLSVKYGASQLKKSYFLSSVSACFVSRLPDPDLVAFLHIAFFY